MARSAKKGPYVQASLMKKVLKAKSSNKREAIKTWSRRSMITPDFVGLNLAVHNGKKFVSIFITESMVGQYLGEFSPTRTFRVHSGQRQAGATTPEQ
jgi:small subunit ribosomal protein S19